MERYGLCLPSESNGKNRVTPISSNLSAWCVDLMRGHPAFCPSSLWRSANILGPTAYRAKAILCFFLIHIPALMMVDFLLVSCGPFLPATKRPTHFRLFRLIFLQIRVLSDNTLSQIHFVLLITHFLEYVFITGLKNKNQFSNRPCALNKPCCYIIDILSSLLFWKLFPHLRNAFYFECKLQSAQKVIHSWRIAKLWQLILIDESLIYMQAQSATQVTGH